MAEEFFRWLNPVAEYFRGNPLLATVWVYLVILNVYVFFRCRHDKLMAIKSRQRVPEMDFFILSFFGGSIGMICGMYAFRHKTKHISFVLGIPFIIIVQICFVLLIAFDGDVNLIRDTAAEAVQNTVKNIENVFA